MPRSVFKGRRRILVTLVLAIGVTGVWLWWSRRVTEPLQRTGPQATAPFVQLAGSSAAASDRVLQERADYFDPAPLFIPTSRNYGGRGLPARLQRQPGQIFGDYGAKHHFTEEGLPAYGTETALVPENVVELLVRANEAPFAGFGEQGNRLVNLVGERPRIHFKRLAGGELSLEGEVQSEVPRRDFSPLEFLILVSPSGVVGDPLLTTGSGVLEVDAFFQDYLVRTHRAGERLAPGVYRVMIGP